MGGTGQVGDSRMMTIQKFLPAFWKDQSGISSVEYALLLAFVAAGIVFSAGLLSDAVQGEMEEAASCIENGTAGGGCG
jgi:Flp pilus assembly pilin Flp